KPHAINPDTIPWVIYTHPEIAWVGQTEQQLKEAAVDYTSGSFPFAANGRALTMIAGEGFIKILCDAKTDRILGIHMVGPHVSELIHEAVLVMEYQGTSEDLMLTMHAHPTLGESMHEAALSVHKQAIHRAN
ncbi:dihydrolipoyl dehydrogenase, partial [Gammaproteobacteria bacterium]|nr:dihydrolipoyl dehydrogenase [Gammaproteobacteria bacterium]